MAKQKKKLSILGICVLLTICLLAVTANTAQATPKRLKIGAIAPLSGVLSVIGLAWGRGYELFFDKINEQGGVEIRNERYLFDFILEDSKLNPEASAIAAKKLVHRDGAKFVFGCTGIDQNSEAVYNVCAPAKVLQIVPWANIPRSPGDVSPKKPLCFRASISAEDAQTVDYDYLFEAYPSVKRIAITSWDVSFEGMIERCKLLAKKHGAEVVGVHFFPVTTQDFLSLYTRVLAGKPDAVHAVVSGASQYQLRAARQLGFKGPFFWDCPLGPEIMARVGGPEAAYNAFGNGMDLGHPTEGMREVIGRWKAKYKEEFVSDALLAWDVAWILIQAIEKAQSLEAAKIIAKLETLTEPGSLHSLFGPAHMGGVKTYGVNRVVVRPVPISSLLDGKVGFVKMALPEIP